MSLTAATSPSMEEPIQWNEWTGGNWGPQGNEEVWVEQHQEEEMPYVRPGTWQWEVVVHGYFAPRVLDDSREDVFAEEYQGTLTLFTIWH